MAVDKTKDEFILHYRIFTKAQEPTNTSKNAGTRRVAKIRIG